MVDSFDPGSGCAARSMIVAAGRWECGNLLVLEISSISTAASGLGAILIAQALHLQGVAVEARQRKGSEVHAIVTIVDRQQRDAFSIQHLAEKHIPLLPVNHPSLPHAAHHAGAAIVRFRYPCGILSRRRAVARLRVFMSSASCGRSWLYSCRNKSRACCWARRLALGGDAASCFKVRCIRSCLPFCSGCPAAMRSGVIPSFIHHTASRDRPAIERPANGGPLSVPIASGMPYSPNPASKMACTRARSIFSTAWQRSRYRLYASVIVNGSMRSPSSVPNHPF